MSSIHELPDGARMAYDDTGSGRPVVLIHGVSMSRRFFERNAAPLAERFRVVNVDLRGHGESPAHEGGHTVAQYARDVKHLLGALGLDDAVVAGWSMGSFVVWDLIRQFGTDGLAGHVVVSQGPSDLKRPDWDLGAFTPAELYELLAAAQADYRGVMSEFVPTMLCDKPSTADLDLLVRETLWIGANAGTCILLDQSLQDYRDVIGSYGLDPAHLGARREARPGRERRVARRADPRRAGRLRAPGALPPVGGAGAVEPGRRRLDLSPLTQHRGQTPMLRAGGRC